MSGHHPRGGDSVTRLRWVLGLTCAFLVVEVVGGLLSNSLALLSDAGHMFSDVAALTLALLAMKQMRRPPDAARSYGYRRLEIVSALANGLLLCSVAIAIAIHSYRRFLEPPEIRGGLMLVVAILGLCVNAAGLILLHRGSRESLGVRGAFLHILGDALGSIGAILAAVVISATGWSQIDAIASLVIAVLILLSAGHLIRESLHILLEGVPRHIDLPEVEQTLRRVEGIEDLHDLHVWRIGSDFDTLTVHLVAREEAIPRQVRQAARAALLSEFGISHCTIEIESAGEVCDAWCHGPERAPRNEG